MKMTKIEYSKVFNLGNYSNEKIGVVIDIADGDNVIDAFAEAKVIVEKSHQFFQDLPTYEKAQKIKSDPDNYTGYQVKQADEAVIAFEANYPDYLQKFNPASRTLTQGEYNENSIPGYED